ncbi:MAG: hypothetical protein QGH24_02325 [Candidatus Marinimicrobia bacterium]|jgi:hypothetical protein|nr:hypothetical protein [Candidatus Neomarinimicrobiota bacterium]|tara:strand:- start:710 stop:1453 length:744 start_codon:yes stop_codon:yes gene_type:complete
MLNNFSKIQLCFLQAFLFFNISCSKNSDNGILYSLLITGDEVKKTGELIQGMPMGLNEIFYESSISDTVFISVHGYGSLGYEWVYPLKLMAESGKQTFYYRWDWNQCPESATGDLLFDLKTLLKENPLIKHLIIFGHSYGGVITANLMDDQFGSVEIHSIAAPLSGHPRFEKECPDFPDFTGMGMINPLTQWRTQHKQDGAFKNLSFNPQDVTISGSLVIQLPKSMNGRGLGHNWSVTWVMDSYFKK